MQNRAEKIVDRFIKNLRIFQFVSILLLLTISVFLYLNISSSNASLMGILSISCAVYLSRVLYAYKQIAKLNEIIDKDCDPETFTYVFQLLKTKPIYRNRITSASLNVAHGQYMQGNYQEAYNLLQEIGINIKSPILKLQFYSIYANCSEAQEDFDCVKWSLFQVKQIADKSKPSPRIAKLSNMLIQIIDGILAEHDKQYGLALEIETALLSAAKFPIQKVSASYRLAKLYFYKEDYITSKSHCEFVIQHGNKLYHVAKAKELLEECEKHIGNMG